MLLRVMTVSVACVLPLLAACGGREGVERESFDVVAPASMAGDSEFVSAKHDVVLTVVGGGGKPLKLDFRTIEQLRQVRFQVKDPSAKKEITYSGVLVRDLLDHLGSKDLPAKLRLSAWDDYAVEIAVADLRRWPVMLATRMNGKRMSLRDGGPTRIVFPYHAYDIDPTRYNDQWIWSIKQIEV